MYKVATKGLTNKIPDDCSMEGRDFLEKCFQIDPKRRASAEELFEVIFFDIE